MKKFFPISEGSGITPKSNEKKDIMKVIKSFENRGSLLKGTTTKLQQVKKEGFFNFLRPLMTAALQLMKCVITSFAKNVLLSLALSGGISAADVAIQKKVIMNQELQHW